MVHAPEPTRFSPGLIGFYASCATVSLGAAVGAVAWIVFGGKDAAGTVAVLGGLMIVAGLIGAIRFLKAARGEA
jgi:hypothetical protein